MIYCKRGSNQVVSGRMKLHQQMCIYSKVIRENAYEKENNYNNAYYNQRSNV